MQNDSTVLNISGRTCTFIEDIDDGTKFSCEEHNTIFAQLTLTFIYLPSLHVLATLYGPKTAGVLGIVWGLLMVPLGLVILMLGQFSDPLTITFIIFSFMILGAAMVLIGLIMFMATTQKMPQENKKSLYECLTSCLSLSFSLIIHGLFLPLLLLLSPLIFILLKFIAISKPSNRLLKAQSTIGSRGESILEAAPQFILQCYIIFLTLTPPGWKKLLSISTSALTLSLKNMEHHVTSRIEEKKLRRKDEEFLGTLQFKMQYSKPPHELKFKPDGKCLVNVSKDTFQELFTRNSIELTSTGLISMELSSIELKSNHEIFGPMSILKNISVFTTASLFKVLVVSILSVFFHIIFPFIIILYSLILLACLGITGGCCYNLKDWRRQIMESWTISWLTITNLGRGKDAALYRLVSTFFWTIVHTITLSMILAICKSDKGNVDLFFVKWSELPLVQDLTTLNILLISTICLGWLSLVLDVITAAVKNHYRSRDNNTEDKEEKVSFWNNAILMEGFKY